MARSLTHILEIDSNKNENIYTVSMISISLKIHHGFKKLLPAGMKTSDPFEISVEDDTAVGDLLRDKIKLSSDIPKMILINGLHSKEQQTLKEGDRVSLFMPMAGG